MTYPNEQAKHMTPAEMVWHERIKQDAKWGEQNHDNFKWLAILGEEFGEVSRNCCEQIPTGKPLYEKDALLDNLEYELVQVAAVCIAWIECLRRNNKEKV